MSTPTETKIPLLDLGPQHTALRDELVATFKRVLNSGRFILGEEVNQFEQEVAPYIGVDHAIGVSSGTDALLVSLMACGVGPGDEVITTPFTFFATAGCVARLGAKPVFVDIDPITFNIDPAAVANAITPQTKAIIPVHIFGQPCDMKALLEVAGDIPLVEDAAQSIGANCCVGPSGGIGAFGCFSFFPSKNLGAFGDGGLVTTNDADKAEQIRVLRAHGSKPKYFHKYIGGNFRIDALQAALLRVKLPHLGGFIEARRERAQRYAALMEAAGLGAHGVVTPQVVHEGHVFHQYVIRTPRRDELKAFLAEHNVSTMIYYPRCLHQQECFADLGYEAGSLPISEQAATEVLALPMYPELPRAHQERVVGSIADFFNA